MKVKFQVEGLKELKELLDGMGPSMRKAIYEALPKILLAPRGGGKPMYPREHSGNRPPTPYYIRGIGTQTKTHNLGNSQQMSARFDVKSGPRSFKLTNTATYATWVIGDNITANSRRRGWKSVTEIIQANMEKIKQVGIDALRFHWKGKGGRRKFGA